MAFLLSHDYWPHLLNDLYMSLLLLVSLLLLLGFLLECTLVIVIDALVLVHGFSGNIIVFSKAKRTHDVSR